MVETPGLTGIRTVAEARRVLLEDALRVAPVVAENDGPIVDVGSGGGSPGLPIAVSFPAREVTLLDGERRKCAFLERFAGELANVTVVWGRAEEQESDVFGVALAKALAKPPVAAELCLPLVRQGGVAVLWVGETADEAAVETVADRLGARLEASTDGLLVLRKAKRTPPGFPRRPGMAKKRPLARDWDAVTEIDLENWDPLSPAQVAQLLGRCPARWWVAGGYAIDAFVGRFDRRPHEDVDIGLLAEDQAAVRACLPGWDLFCADPPGVLRPWRPEELLEEPVHDVWGRPAPDQPWRLALVLNTSDAGDWTYRRDSRIRRPVSELVWRRGGIPYLAPEVQLLFKSKTIRPKDEQDFGDALPLLGEEQRDWLGHALEMAHPGHPWLHRL